MRDLYFFHFRLFKDEELNARGGATVCAKITDHKTIDFGIAVCSPSDNFCRKTGRELAEFRVEEDNKRSYLHFSCELEDVDKYILLADLSHNLANHMFNITVARLLRKGGCQDIATPEFDLEFLVSIDHDDIERSFSTKD